MLRECEALSALPGAGSVVVSHDVHAVAGSDVVYTDSWMSYGIPKEEQARRMAALQPFQVTADTMRRAGRDAIFMNCLPAMRGMEQSAEVVDGPQSVVFDQAENRLHAQKALLLWLLNRRVFDHAAFRMRAVKKLV